MATDPEATINDWPAPPSSERRFRVPIRLKVLCLLVILATVVSAVVATTLIRFFNEDKATYIQDLNADIASNTAASVELLLHLYRQRVGRVAETFNTAEASGSTLKYLLETSDDFIYLAVYDQDRNNVLSLCRERSVEEAGLDVSEFLAVRERLEFAPDYLESQGNVIQNSSSSPQLLTFSMLVPFYAPSHDRTFAIRAEFLAEPLLKAIRRTPGTTYVVDKRGDTFLHPDAASMAARRSMVDRGVVKALLESMTKAAAGTGEFEQANGELFLASYAVVRGAGLGVLVERPKRDAFLAADRLTRRSTHAAFVIILIAAAFSVVLSRALLRPLLELSAAANRLERGDFRIDVQPRSHDELGDLARSFNLAAKGLEERDVKLKQAYEGLLQSEKLAGLGKFTAGIAHEVKNPLTGIIGFAQILARKMPDDDPKRRPVMLIEKEAKRCKQILDNLLKFTRQEGFRFEPVRLHRHLEGVLDLVSPQLHINQVTVTTELAAPDDLIRGDANQLQQVFMNLILNSIDAMELLPAAERRIHLSTVGAGDGYLDVRVADSGPGIPEGILRKVFDPFFTTKEPGKGTGLGLSVSYGIVTNHGGTIGARNRPEGGAEFCLHLPVGVAEVRGEERRLRRLGDEAAARPVLVGVKE